MFKRWRFIRLFKSRHRDTWVPNFNIFFWSVQRVSPPKSHNIYPIIAVSISILKSSLALRCEWLTQFFISRLITGSSRVSHSSYQIVNGIFRQEPQERVKREFCESFSLIRYKQIDMRSRLQLWVCDVIKPLKPLYIESLEYTVTVKQLSKNQYRLNDSPINRQPIIGVYYRHQVDPALANARPHFSGTQYTGSGRTAEVWSLGQEIFCPS